MLDFSSIFPYKKFGLFFVWSDHSFICNPIIIILLMHDILPAHLIIIDLISLPALCEAEASYSPSPVFRHFFSRMMSYLSHEFLTPSFVYAASFRVRELVSLVYEIADCTTGFLDFVHRPVFQTEHNSSETENTSYGSF
jgi:hypothetical protein